jgi:hypothetical protein
MMVYPLIRFSNGYRRGGPPLYTARCLDKVIGTVQRTDVGWYWRCGKSSSVHHPVQDLDVVKQQLREHYRSLT